MKYIDTIYKTQYYRVLFNIILYLYNITVVGFIEVFFKNTLFISFSP